MTFIHLHNHSHYSILEGLPKPEQYVKKAKQLGMEAVALTDTSNLHGCHEFYKACKSEGIKPILGTEIFVESSLDPKISHKLVLLSKDLDGYRNIIQLVTKANLDNPGTRAKIKFEDIIELKEKCSGASCVSPDLKIIALSGPISGEIPFYILSGKTDEEILERIKQYQNVFGIDDFYLELLEHSDVPKQELVTKELIRISEKYKIPVVAAQNTHYINKEDNTTQDVIKALGTGHELENPDRPTLINGDYSFLSEEDMQMLFGFIPEALENTKKIADKINIEIETGGILIPTFELPESDEIIYNKALKLEKSETDSGNIKKLDSSEWYLRYLSFKGLNSRFDFGLDESTIFELIKKLDKPSLNKKLTETLPEELKTLSLTYYTDKKKEIIGTYTKNWQEIIDRLEYELVVVHEMGFDAYFLIVADYINWARNNEIPVGPGRGSAAGSLMAYLSGITDLDPLKYDLLFERFLNPARVSMPDIDTDFADSELYKVVDYCIEKYGADKVVRVCTFGTFAARAAVKDVGRVYGIPFAEMNALVKTIPEKPGTKLKGAIEDSVEFAEAYEDKRYTKLIDNALKIEGNVRQLGVHACAVIIAPEPMTKFTALQHPPKDENSTVTQYSAYPLEDLGLLKMDFLGLRNLTIIKRARKIIELNKGEKIDILNLDMSDEKALQVFVDGDTSGVFQFESDGMRKYLRDLKPNSFNDLIAMVSLYRPGPIAYIPNYIDRKYGREEVQYMTSDLKEIMTKAGYDDKVIEEQKLMLEEDLKKILDVTYGIAVYQEQLMFIVQYMAGFSLGEADLLRRGVGKKKLDVIEALKKEFKTKGESYRGYKPEVTQYIYEEMIQPAANYSFNKSHAACYALISYQTAYLKAYYPTEFLTSLMVSDEENMDRIEMEVGECEVKGISVLAPNINSSLKHFTYVDDKTIIFGLKAIKGIGDGPINRIIETRKEIGGVFEDLEHFIESCGKEVINKKTLEALIRSGAMDSFEERNKMLSSIPSMIAFSRKDEKKKETNQIGLFDNSSTFEEKLKLEDSIVMDFEEKLTGEKEVIGFWISGHPLDGLGRYCARRGQNIKKLKMSFEELSRLEKLENPENQETSPQASPEVEVVEQKKVVKEKSKNLYNEGENCQVIGVITDFRKIFTKTGKVMMFLKCEGYDYEFEVVLFAKDVEKYAEKIDNFKIIIVNGFLDINLEYSRKSVKPRDIKIVSISQVRDQARDMGFLDENIKRFKNNDLNIVEEYSDTTDDFENKLEEKILDSKVEKKEKNQVEQYIIDVPKNAKRQDLVDLKEFLLSKKSGDIEVFINLNGGKVSTKISLKDTSDIERRVRKNIFN